MKIERNIFIEILRDACQAPSGDNTQPWKFKVVGNSISIINVPEKDTSLFNWQQVTNHIALGACIENLRISAENHGFHVNLKLFPDTNNSLVVAKAVLTSDASIHNNLAPLIKMRASNRKKYYTKQIEQEKLLELAALANNIGGRVVFVTNRAKLKKIAHIVSTGEKLALENKSIHDFLFEHVTWTKEEDAKKHGFFIDTFEFTPPQKIIFKLFKNWNILKLFIPLGFSNFVAKDMERVHTTSAAFGAVVLSSSSAEKQLNVGILLERLWLTATKLGLSLQPTTTVHFIGARVLSGESDGLSLNHQNLLCENYTALTKEFGINRADKFGFIFRLGYADSPSATTTRFEPEVIFED